MTGFKKVQRVGLNMRGRLNMRPPPPLRCWKGKDRRWGEGNSYTCGQRGQESVTTCHNVNLAPYLAKRLTDGFETCLWSQILFYAMAHLTTSCYQQLFHFSILEGGGFVINKATPSSLYPFVNRLC